MAQGLTVGLFRHKDATGEFYRPVHWNGERIGRLYRVMHWRLTRETSHYRYVSDEGNEQVAGFKADLLNAVAERMQAREISA